MGLSFLISKMPLNSPWIVGVVGVVEEVREWMDQIKYYVSSLASHPISFPNIYSFKSFI